MRLNPPPKIYSKHLITEFMKKRKEARIQAEEKKLRENFKYPPELLKNIESLPPSLRPLDVKMLETHSEKTFFGAT